MISLTDKQLEIVMSRARLLPTEKRELFLQKLAAQIELRWGNRRTDDDAIAAGAPVSFSAR